MVQWYNILCVVLLHVYMCVHVCKKVHSHVFLTYASHAELLSQIVCFQFRFRYHHPSHCLLVVHPAYDGQSATPSSNPFPILPESLCDVPTTAVLYLYLQMQRAGHSNTPTRWRTALLGFPTAYLNIHSRLDARPCFSTDQTATSNTSTDW